MFDTASISRLQEKLDYKQWAIFKALEILESYQGPGSRAIVFINKTYETHLLELHESVRTGDEHIG